MKKLNKDVEKPWGGYYDMAEETGKWHLKVIEVKKGQRLSLQKHQMRSEFWVIADGEAKIQKDEETLTLKTGDTIAFKKEEAHRAEGITDTTIIEVTFGEHDEDDITRLADDYGRS